MGLLGSSPFTLAGDPATDNLVPTGELTLDDLTGEAPAGIGVLDTGPIASGNQVGVNAGDVSPSVPVTVCGNGVGVLGDASASCAPGQPAAPSGGSTGTGSTGTSAGTGDATSDSLLGSFASGNQVDAGIGDISPSVPVTVCGNGVGVLGDASAGCGAAQPAAPSGGSSSGTTGSTQADGTLAGNQVDASAGDISPSVPVTVCGNSVGALGDASASCGTGQPATSTGGASAGASGSTQADGTLAGNQAEVSVGDVAATVPVTASCNSVGLLGDASSNCGTSTSPGTDPGTDTGIDTDTGIGVDIGVNTGGEISTGGIIAPPPGTTSPGGDDTDGPGSTGTSGIPGIPGLTPGSGGADGSVTSFAPVRPSVAGSGALPFTGAASDLLAIAAFGLLIAGALVVRATRPAAAQEGGGDR